MVQDILFTPYEPKISYGQGLWDMAELLFLLGAYGCATWCVVRLARNALLAVSGRHSKRTEASPAVESAGKTRRAA